MQTPSNLLFSKFQPQEFNQLCQEISNRKRQGQLLG